MKKYSFIFILLLSSCHSNLSSSFDTLTLSEQPIVPGSFCVNLSNDSDYFYEKFITDNLIERMQKRGWTYNPTQAKYVLKVRFYRNEETRSVSQINQYGGYASTYNIITDKGLTFHLDKSDNVISCDADQSRRKPVLFSAISAGSSYDKDIVFSNNVIPIIDNELQTKNMYQNHLYTCERTQQYSSKKIESKCYSHPTQYLWPKDRESKTFEIFKTHLIPYPYAH